MYIYYVYQYLREDLTPYYIGKGKGKRAWDKKHRINLPTTKELIQIVAHKLSEQEAHLLEIKLICQYGRKDLGTGILRNMSNGGEGATGYKHTEEFKENTRKFHTGKITSEETKKKQSLAAKGKHKSEEHKKNLRKPRSAEFKAKMSEIAKNRTVSPRLGKKHSDETKALLSTHRKGKTHVEIFGEDSPAILDKISKSQKARKNK